MSDAFLVVLAINVIAAIGMHLVYVTGQLNLGQAGFLAVGAYATVLTEVELDWSLAPSLLAGALAAALVALPVAVGAARLQGVYLIMGTLAIGEIVRITIGNADALGGVQGFSGQSFVEPTTVYVIAGVVLAGAFALMTSSAGLKMRSVFDDADAAAAAGVATWRVRVLSVVVSAAVVGVAGGLLAKWLLFIAPRDFGIEVSFEIALFTLLGGVHSLLGAVAGAAGITGLLDGLSRLGDLPVIGESVEGLARWRLVIYGALVVLLMVYRPEGLVSRRLALRATAPFRRLRRRWFGRRDAGAAPAPLSRSARPPPASEPLPPAVPDAPVVLEVSALSHGFGGVQALQGVDLTVRAGEAVALIGANGAGKSTLVNVVAGRYPCQHGTVRLHGTDIARWSAHRRTRAGVSRTFQSVRVFAHLTVEETVRLGHWAGSGRERGSVEALLALLGLLELRDALPDQLTLAEQRRLEIGRAIASAPAVILLDEPSAGLNDHERAELAELIRALPQRGTAVVLVDHNLDFAFGIGTRVVVLDFGEVIVSGTPARVMADPRVRDAYLGAEADRADGPSAPVVPGRGQG